MLDGHRTDSIGVAPTVCDRDRVIVATNESSKGCSCPAARYRAARANDLDCECTAATHQAVFEAALDPRFPGEILETARRGGRTCHFVVHVVEDVHSEG